MEKHTGITYTVYGALIRLCPHDGDIVITDPSSHETVTIQGLDPEALRISIISFVHLSSVIKDDPAILDWYKVLKGSLEDCIKSFESSPLEDLN
jgi:hypothetical protein